MTIDKEAMRARFIGPNPLTKFRDHWFELLWTLYTRPDRHYHSIWHISDLLRRLDALPDSLFGDEASSFGRRRIVEWAIWFHDAIYCVPARYAGSNEDDSAALAKAFVAIVGDPHDVSEVTMAIYETRHSGECFATPYSRIMVDLDLAGFADPWQRFSESNALIRKEYAIYDEEAYRKGRIAFLRGLLARDRIFYVLTEHEAPARANIERHISELELGGTEGGQ